MQTKYLSILAATIAAVTGVSAGNVERVDVVHIFKTLHVVDQVPNLTPDKRSINALFARDSNEKFLSSDCASQEELDDFNEQLGNNECSDSGAVVFTAASTTQTVDLQTAFPSWTPLATSIENTGVARDVSNFAIAAAAGVAGFMIAA
ncbi:infection structure specific [Fusarium longipes]|uniref:Infection structure specific n=1 Tax=Fusarium longipes TaxID=694270 RepID=A0A395RP03_9HYPO|nr:infection structure specific [Fusarium longipes]